MSEKEQLIYFLILTTIYSVLATTYINQVFYDTVTNWDIAIDASVIVITFVGTLFVFNTNAKGDSKDFIARYICLSFPVIIQVVLLTLMIAVSLYIADELTSRELITYETNTLDWALVSFVTIVAFLRLNGAIKIASSGPTD